MAGSREHGKELSGSKNVEKFLSNCATGGFWRRAQIRVVS
jgi:hypothetical protein